MRTKQGIITSAKMTDTVTVTVHRSVFHPIYKKRYRTSKKFLADAKGYDLAEGDMVIISECRPMSKNKHFRVTEIVKSAPRLSKLKEEEHVTAALNHKKEVTEQEEVKEKSPSPSSKTSHPSNSQS
ncbi:MAG: ribosomal protein [Candidatus Peribacteria bacterium]|nr:ribosomal protein [Candidatus Peribacteria bacterium]